MHLLPLGAFRPDAVARVISALQSLNAPSGAQCFPTREIEASWAMVTPSQCTFWCSVLSDRNDHHGDRAPFESQCTFWCSVLSDPRPAPVRHPSMLGLNAPSGAQCFPTPPHGAVSGFDSLGLNAPSGAQCFPTLDEYTLMTNLLRVSMHLLVLSAFRPDGGSDYDKAFAVSMHLLVLSAFRLSTGTL